MRQVCLRGLLSLGVYLMRTISSRAPIYFLTEYQFGFDNRGYNSEYLGTNSRRFMDLAIKEHPLLDCRAVVTKFPKPLGRLLTPQDVLELLSESGVAPFSSDDNIRKLIRDLFRHSGFKPTGRSKPASEYLLKAAKENKLGSINVAVDIGNVVSLHTGIPISVVDLDLVESPLRVDVAPAGASYIFNQSGQEIDISHLICLFDQLGPCANAVKDSQRTKTSDSTTQTMTILWGTEPLMPRVQEAVNWVVKLSSEYDVNLANLH